MLVCSYLISRLIQKRRGGGNYANKYVFICYEIDILIVNNDTRFFCRNATNGFYHINDSSNRYTKTYCQMTSLTGCSGGGWTLVMKTDGRKVCKKERKNIKTSL